MRQQAVEDLLRGSLTTVRAAQAATPAEQILLATEAAWLYAAGALGVGAASEMERWHTEVRDQADRRLRVPLDLPSTLRNTSHVAAVVTYSTPCTRTHWARDANRGTGRTQTMLEQAAQHAGPVTVVAADELQVSMLRQRLRQLGAGHVQVCSVPSVVAGRLHGRSDLVLWDHYALERFPGVDPALYSRDAVAG
jgi:hypothetical protein